MTGKAPAPKARENGHNRVEYDDDGSLDEVVTDGGAHLEHMGDDDWFLVCTRADGSSFAAWFSGKITLTEERSAPTCRGCGKGIPANSPGDDYWLKCPACGWSARPHH